MLGQDNMAVKKLSNREQIKAITSVAALSFKIAPGAVLFKIGGALFGAVLPLLTTYYAALTTTALAAAYAGSHEAGKKVITYVITTALLGLAMTIWRSLDNYIQAKMRYLVEARISDQMYTHFLSLEFWRYDDKDTADLYERALKFSRFFAWIFDRLAQIVSQLIGVGAAIIALALFKPILALVVFASLVPGIYLQFKLSRKQIAHWNENVEVRRAQSMLEWQFGQPKLIAELRLYGMVSHLMQLRRKLRDTDEKGRLSFERKYIPNRIAADMLEAVVEAGALIWIVAQIVARNHPVGQFVYVQQIVSRAMNSASSLASTLGSIDEDIANLFDYQQFISLPTVSHAGIRLQRPPKVIAFKHVSFAYPGAKQNALNDISLTIQAQEHIAVVGENGAGKTTFVKLLTGLYKPTKGQILIDGVDLNDINTATWHKQLGVLQQDFIHYNFANARDNVRFGAVDEQHTKERLANALRAAEAEKFTAKLPQGLDTYVNNWMEDDAGNKGVDLSGGQWQRLALARDFYRHAPIVILDEPTSAIDALAEARIFKHLFDQGDRTVITISHRMSTVERADRIYMFEEGKLAETGTHVELKKARKQYFNMFESQMLSD
jgi:ATP-binding cassette subfamily B protein/ATP-binding cassette subfamily C protein